MKILKANLSSVTVPSTPPTRRGVSPRRFLFNELKTATWNFHPHNKLGEGGFGPVFKGWVDDDISTAFQQPGTGILIAVKRVNQEGLQGHREWLVGFTHVILAHMQFLYFLVICFWYHNSSFCSKLLKYGIHLKTKTYIEEINS